MNTAIKKYPLLFSYRDLIAGRGFVAGVSIVGRVLLEVNDGECWMYGVQPGGFAGGGADKNTAFCEFKNSYLSVLYDLAIEARTFDAFKSQVESFFAQINLLNAQEWDAALAAVRQNGTSLEGLAKVNADSQQCGVQVVLLDMAQTTPQDNQFGVLHEAA